MDHPQELSLLVTHLEALFNILENQYIQLAGLPLIERNQTSALRDKLKSQMKDIVLVLEQLNECYSAGKKIFIFQQFRLSYMETRTFDVLSVHRVKATFQGIKHQPCRFMTSLCPDRCGHATDIGLFKVDEYEHYEKLGEYGDEEQTMIYVSLKADADEDKQDPAIIAQIRTLTPGQKVKLLYEHIYVTQGGSKFPERPVRMIEPIE
ncbi:putative Tvp14 [Monocercomonoides exilis]|uniref:putative Tvp14 n=1 Tax=Monocercomonoides exilis TaxID=2049356 RepID=UPI003559C21A|nr:putative Tvp14 [Monocercomonoides exilis]|eukprot:MONOS_14973.1-p1 / transcript=MONOS_14973.1 / gene=MONOS_14973 / organism=Monocercomonoides_exilis_PA203 / gene_product=Tvp14 / transcript_product=Tvp14 / location=Mono_scaffold01118:6365-7437(-) / protein_length=206 / sequence_SO=supercontig / SO=protein_coding / is_pseudo=false